MVIPYKKILYKGNQIIIDLLIFVFSFLAAYFIRFEGFPPGIHSSQIWILLPYVVIARFMVFYAFSVYSIVWRYISISDAFLIFKAVLPITGVIFVARVVLPKGFSSFKVPYGVIVLEFLLVLLGTTSIRMLRRLIFEAQQREQHISNGCAQTKNVLLIGAGNAGNIVLKELKQRVDLGLNVVGFIDDDPQQYNTVIHGVKVLGSTAQIPQLAEEYNVDEAVITIANASSKDIRRIVDICETAKIKVKIIPGIFELFDDHIKISKIRDVNIDDLLGRSVVEFENNVPEIVKRYRNKRILITGAGGSIGAELCRQLAALWPKELILLDKDENSVFEIDAELRRKHENLKLVPVIADVRFPSRLRSIFERFHPHVIFHAAAHKHVPLMEANVSEAIMNNVTGTKNMAELAHEYGVDNFIFISTDKAVNPTSVMGASKKIGEILIQEIAKESPTHFSCVRFGNVLGSRGSVVPFFQSQIANGGPVTVTHPDVVRYFMSLSEAVQLIIKAGTIGENGEIFVLDMGKPIKIIDLAKDLIRLSGFKEDEIEIKFIGLRPGEKLYEEILVDEEKVKSTNFQKIFIAPPLEVDKEIFSKELETLIDEAQSCNGGGILDCLRRIGIGYDGDRSFH